MAKKKWALSKNERHVRAASVSRSDEARSLCESGWKTRQSCQKHVHQLEFERQLILSIWAHSFWLFCFFAKNYKSKERALQALFTFYQYVRLYMPSFFLNPEVESLPIRSRNRQMIEWCGEGSLKGDPMKALRDVRSFIWLSKSWSDLIPNHFCMSMAFNSIKGGYALFPNSDCPTG